MGVDFEATLLLEGKSGRRHEKREQSGGEARLRPHAFLRRASEHRQLALGAGPTGPTEATALTLTPRAARAWGVQESACTPLRPAGDWQGHLLPSLVPPLPAGRARCPGHGRNIQEGGCASAYPHPLGQICLVWPIYQTRRANQTLVDRWAYSQCAI